MKVRQIPMAVRDLLLDLPCNVLRRNPRALKLHELKLAYWPEQESKRMVVTEHGQRVITAMRSGDYDYEF